MNDLLGSASGPEEEVAEARVSERYLVGMLAPKKQRAGAETMDALEVAREDPEDGPFEPTVVPARRAAGRARGRCRRAILLVRRKV